jgi:hypothetical protein
MQMIVVLLIGACVACGSLVDTDYAGEPLFRLQGVAPSTEGTRVTMIGVKGAALWQAPDPAASRFMRMPLRIEFPSFWIDVMSAPHDDVVFRLDAGEPAIGEAYLHIVKSETGAVPRAEDFVATDYEHVLVHVSAEVPPAGLTATYLGAALAPGFHVMTRASTNELTAPQQVLVEQCAASAPGSERVRASCMAQRLYRLTPSPDDLGSVLRFHLTSTGR